MKKVCNIATIITIVICLALIIINTLFPIYRNALVADSSGSERIYIASGETRTFDFEVIDDYVMGIQLYNADNLYNVNVEFAIYDGDEMIYHNALDTICGRQNVFLFEETLKDQKGKSLTVEIKVVETKNNLNFATNEEGNLRVDQISHEKSFNVMLCSYFVLTVALIIFFINNYRQTILSDVSKKIRFLLVVGTYFASSLVFAFFSLYGVYYTNFKDEMPIWLMLIITVSLVITTFIATQLFMRNRKKMEIIFLVFFIPIASMYCAFFMPGDGQDGHKHYARVYSIVNGEFVAGERAEVPALVLPVRGYATVKEMFEKMLETTDYETTYGRYYADYNPVLYTVPVIGVFTGKILNLNPYVGWYIAKIFNFVFSAVIGFIIVKKIPKFKLLTILYLMIPMNIYQFVSLSTDILINLAALLFLALALEKYYNKAELKLADYIIIFLCSFILIIGKVVYFPIIIALLFLIRKSINKSKHSIIKIAFVLVLAIALYMLWNHINIPPAIELTTDNLKFAPTGPYYVITHPFQTIYMFINYLISSPDQYLLDFIGYKFIWSSVSVPIAYTVLYLALLFVAALCENVREKIDIKSGIVITLCVLASFGLTVMAMYGIQISSNPVLSTLWGVQGRYFFPIFILLLILLGNIKIFSNKFNYTRCIYIGLIGIQLLYIWNFIGFVIT